jgi:hypothetical protein
MLVHKITRRFSLKAVALKSSLFHLVEAHLFPAAVLKLRRARRGVVRHGSGLFERPAVLQIGGDAGRAEAVERSSFSV